jgi:hypothetical protein
MDLLGFDDAPEQPASYTATHVSVAPADDPFALLVSAAPTMPSTTANDWSDFTAPSSVAAPAIAPAQDVASAATVSVTPPAAPAKSLDPFESLVGGGLAAQLQGVTVTGQSSAPAKSSTSKPVVSPDDIMKLYDSQSNNGFSDFFSAAPPAAPTAAHFGPTHAPLPAQQFAAPVLPSKGLQAPGIPPFTGMQPALSPGFGASGMIPAYGGASHPVHPQQAQVGMHQTPGLGGFGGLASTAAPQAYGVQSHAQPSLQNQQQAGLLNNPAAFASLVSLHTPGFGAKKA